MGHSNFNKFPKDYKTFAELAEYARKRARHSAARNGHQEFAYWVEIALWASHPSMASKKPAAVLKRELEEVAFYGGSPGWVSFVARDYAHAVHLRQMLINRGEKPPRLSLAWLREAAKRL
jgi:hypothetical protein